MTNNYRLRLAGMDEFQGAIRQMQSKMPRALQAAFDEAAQLVVNAAEPKIPRKTGAAAASLKTKSSPAGMNVIAGGKKVPYFAWLDYGGRVGRKKSVKRRFYKEGRYIWPTFADKRDEVSQVLAMALLRLAEAEGFEVS